MKLVNIPQSNIEKQEKGVWVEFPTDDNIRFKLARSSSKKVVAAFALEAKKNPRASRHKDMVAEIENRVASRYIVLGWENIFYEDEKTGEIKELVYSHETALKLLSDEKNQDLRTWIFNESDNLLNFTDMTIEEEDAEEENKDQLKKS